MSSAKKAVNRRRLQFRWLVHCAVLELYGKLVTRKRVPRPSVTLFGRKKKSLVVKDSNTSASHCCIDIISALPRENLARQDTGPLLQKLSVAEMTSKTRVYTDSAYLLRQYTRLLSGAERNTRPVDDTAHR